MCFHGSNDVQGTHSSANFFFHKEFVKKTRLVYVYKFVSSHRKSI